MLKPALLPEAGNAMNRVFDQLEQKGAAEEAAALRKQLDRILPAFREEDLAEP